MTAQIMSPSMNPEPLNMPSPLADPDEPGQRRRTAAMIQRVRVDTSSVAS